jgi:CRP/FNR family transcriptional regulator, cyclic AMP receptor protein
MKNVLFILGQLTDLDADWLAATGRKVKLAAGDTLVAEGRAVDAVSIVLEGELVSSHEGAGRELRRMGPGEVVGEMSFIDASPPSATVRALTRGVVLQVPRLALAQRLASDDGFGARFYRAMAMMLSDRLRTATAVRGEQRPASALEDDELDPNVLDAVSRAGDRFGRMLQRLSTGR